jgi:hypothetical protein
VGVPNRPRCTLRSDRNAVGQVVAFLVAGVIFVAATAAILVATRSSGGNDHGSHEASQQTQANRLADLLVGSPGVGWNLGNDHILRLGLQATNGSGLQQSSLDALRGALMTSALNGKVDYPDARQSLALSGTQDFHIRMYPVALSSVYQSAAYRQHIAYIGDWSSLPSVTVSLGTPAGEQAAAQARMNLTMAGASTSERTALRELGLNFVDKVFIGPSAPTVLVNQIPPLPAIPLLTALNLPSIPGDVYPDIKSYLDANLPGQLANYDLLVVGSDVDQSSLTTGGTKFAISNWVQAGGTLIVLGTGNLNYQWLQPLFGAGVKTANGAASAPDPSHPLLQDPFVLNWQQYDDHSQGWSIKSPGFTFVITQGPDGALALSNDGAFGSGRVILTTYEVDEIAASLGQTEANHFLDNLFLYTNHGNLFLEYGPIQPDNAPVAVAVRQSYLFDDTLGQVPVRIEVHFWGSP